MLKYLILFLIALISSFIFTPLVRVAARRLGAYDLPDERKVHGKPIPRLGGFSIFVCFHLILIIFTQFNFFHFPSNFLERNNYWWLLAASTIVLGLGALDDFRRKSPSIKFIFQIIAGLIVALTCCKIYVIALPFGIIDLGIWSIPVTVLWVVAITNAINLLDGLDGLAAGTSFIAFLAMFGISLLNEKVGLSLSLVILLGSILGFLKYNFHPASVFLGDSGAYFLGFTLSVISILSNLKGPTTVAILIPILALGLPIMDTILSMVRRLFKSLHIVETEGERNRLKFFFIKGWSMFRADRDHIHHRLLKMGLSQRNVVIILYTITLILGGVALSSVYFRNINHAFLITSIGIGSYIGIRKLGYDEIQFLRNGTLLPLFDSSLISRRIIKVFVDIALVTISYYLAFLLRFEGELSPAIKKYYLSSIPLVLIIKMVVFYLTGLYKGAWRYINVDDFVTIFRAVILGCTFSALMIWMLPFLDVVSWAVLFIDFILLFFLIAGVRSSLKILEHLNASKNNQGRKVLIYGVGRQGIHALKESIDNHRLGLSPVGFIDDDPRNKDKQVNGYPVLGPMDSIENILEDHSISEVIVSSENIPREKLARLSQICHAHHIVLRRFRIRLEKIPFNGKSF